MVSEYEWGLIVRMIGIRAKVENVHQYNEYLTELQSMREEMGVVLKEDLFPNTMGGERTNPA